MLSHTPKPHPLFSAAIFWVKKNGNPRLGLVYLCVVISDLIKVFSPFLTILF